MSCTRTVTVRFIIDTLSILRASPYSFGTPLSVPYSVAVRGPIVTLPPSLSMNKTAQDVTQNPQNENGDDHGNDNGDALFGVGQRLHAYILERSSAYRRLVSVREKVSPIHKSDGHCRQHYPSRFLARQLDTDYRFSLVFCSAVAVRTQNRGDYRQAIEARQLETSQFSISLEQLSPSSTVITVMRSWNHGGLCVFFEASKSSSNRVTVVKPLSD